MGYAAKISFDQIDWENGEVGRSMRNKSGKGMVPVIQNRLNNKLYYCTAIPESFLTTQKFLKLKNIAVK